MIAQFLVLALAWGASFLFIKVALEGLSPAQVVLGRLLAGAVALLIVSAASRTRLPPWGRAWAHLAVVSVFLCVLPFLLFAWAEEHLSLGLASGYNATTPLTTMLIALVALPEERDPGPDRGAADRLRRGAGRARAVARSRRRQRAGAGRMPARNDVLRGGVRLPAQLRGPARSRSDRHGHGAGGPRRDDHRWW